MSVLATALAQSMTTSPHDLVVLDRETGTWRRHPWPQVHALAESIAGQILDGDAGGAIGLVGDPSVELVAAIQGTWLAGASVSILPGPVRGADPRQWADATMGRFTSIGVRAVYSDGGHLGLLRDAAATTPVHHVVTAAHAGGSSTVALPGGAPRDGSPPAVLQGTAGSTGVPRTAVLSADAVLNNLRGIVAHIGVDASHDVGCSWLPLYHDMGLTFLLSSALAGIPIWLAPTAAFAASPFRWLHWLSESEATLTAAPNFAYNVIGKYARRVSDVDLGGLRFAINGGEPIDCEGFARFEEALAPFGFDAGAAAPCYGLAESTCAVTAPTPGTGLQFDAVPTDVGTRRHAIVGAAIPGMEIRVVPVDGAAETAGPTTGRAVGEIEIRGTSMMDGYLGAQAIDGQDWFPTGDLGYLAEGGLVVCGRAKEIISVAGRNIFPTEVEQVAARVHGVREGAVVAVATRDRGPRPGLLVAAEFRGPDEAGARSELMQRVASVCGVVPSEVILLPPGSLPRTSSGKLRRLEVRRNVEAAPS